MQIKDGDIFRKKCTAILTSLLLIMICLIPVHAEEIQTENPSFEFELTANGEESIEATTGDIITVVLKLKRTDQNVPIQCMRCKMKYSTIAISLSLSKTEQP